MTNQLLTNNKVDRDSVQDIDFHQRRVTNAGDAVDARDYVTKQQLDALTATVAKLTTAIQKAGITI